MELPLRAGNQLVQTEDEDKFSSLPDGVLVSILDKLGSTRQAVRAGVLSRRWVHLPWLLPKPYITIDAFLRTELAMLKMEDLDRGIGAFHRAVARFVDSAETTKCLILEFYLMEKLTLPVRRLLTNAIDNGKVSEVQFLIRTVVSGELCTDMHRLQYARSLMGFVGFSPKLFASLTKLRLQNLRLGDIDISVLLCTCQRLEYLTLYNCGHRGAVLMIDTPESELKELVIIMSSFEQIELRSAPKLVQLTCNTWFSDGAPLYLCSVPRLQKLILINYRMHTFNRFKLSELLANTKNLDYLSLDFGNDKIWIQPEHAEPLSAVLSKLTILSVNGIYMHCLLLWMMSLLEATPFLQKFSITVSCHGEDSEEVEQSLWWEDSNFKHDCLQELKVTGFEAYEEHMSFIRLVMERATNLKSVILADEEACGGCFYDDDQTSLRRRNYPKNKYARDYAENYLMDGISSAAEILWAD